MTITTPLSVSSISSEWVGWPIHLHQSCFISLLSLLPLLLLHLADPLPLYALPPLLHAHTPQLILDRRSCGTMDSSISLSPQTHLTSTSKTLHTLDTLLILCPLGVFFKTPMARQRPNSLPASVKGEGSSLTCSRASPVRGRSQRLGLLARLVGHRDLLLILSQSAEEVCLRKCSQVRIGEKTLGKSSGLWVKRARQSR